MIEVIYDLEIEDGEVYDLEVSDGEDVECELASSIVINEIVGEPYEGPYEVTPSAETQILPTAVKTADSDIVINPIPNNYGLITYDGSCIRVS